MARLVLTQTVNAITTILEQREEFDDRAPPESAYQVDGQSYPVKSTKQHGTGLFVELEAEPTD